MNNKKVFALLYNWLDWVYIVWIFKTKYLAEKAKKESDWTDLILEEYYFNKIF